MKETRKQPAEANIKNLFFRYQNYDSDGTKYAFDIRYTTLHTAGESFKAKKQTGADTFMRHIKELTENYQDVSSIIVSDYGGANAKAVLTAQPCLRMWKRGLINYSATIDSWSKLLNTVIR